MDIFLQNQLLDSKQLEVLNRCRMYLRCFTLSDIVTGDGKEISTVAWAGSKSSSIGRDSQGWPIIPPPSASDWKTWRHAIRITLCTNRDKRLDTLLRSWIAAPSHLQWFLSMDAQHLFHIRDNGQWIVHEKASMKTQSLRFLTNYTLVERPTHEISPTTVFHSHDCIVAEGISSMISNNIDTGTKPRIPNWLYHSKDTFGDR